jgi:GAF domain-containing protein
MGQVHLAYDSERNEEVAVKLLVPAPGADKEEALFLFKQEFWAMTVLGHPNLVAAYDYGELPDGTPYFTMEYVQGRDLSPLLPTSEEAVRGYLPGVIGALGYLHGQGYVHGDLKPENIRLQADGTAKLMDLGLLARAGHSGGAIRGSLAYMAPETIRQSTVDGRADLYALGAVLYHLLCGRAPFEGDDAMAILRAHLERPPADPRELRPELTSELAGAIARLLAKDPGARFPHAAALLEALGIRGAETAPTALFGSPLIGRNELQSKLVTLIEQLQPSVFWLVGEAGAGKTRLLQEARIEAQLKGVAVLEVRGLDPDAPPYQALRPLLHALLEGPLAVLERLGPILIKLLPEAPALKAAGIVAAPALEGAQERLRLQLAIAELALERHSSAVWLIDDWDRLDSASRDLLASLRRQGVDRPWRWVLSASSGPADEEFFNIQPLDEADTRLFACALLGQEALPEPVLLKISALSGGQPGAIGSLLDHWRRRGALRWSRAGWTAGPDYLFEVPGGLKLALDTNFEALSEEVRRVARGAALLGSEGELLALEALFQGEQVTIFPFIRALEEAGLLEIGRTVSGAASYRFARPMQAAHLLATCAVEERWEWHARAGRWLSRRLGGDPDAEAVPLAGLLAAARHHLEGNVPLEGLPWVLASVRRAIAVYELDAAESLVAQALVVPGLTPLANLTLDTYKANAVRHQGRTEEAVNLYRNSDLLERLERADHPFFLDELVTFGALLAITSAYADARPVLERAIALADQQGRMAQGVRARQFAGRVAYFAGEADTAKATMVDAIALARSADLPDLLASTLSFYGYMLSATDLAQAAEGLELLDEAIQINRRQWNVVAENEVLNLQGNVLMAANRFEEARAAFQVGLDNAHRYGIDLDEVPARLNLGTIALELGDLTTARSEARLAAEMAGDQGRKFLHAYALALEGATLISSEPAAGSDMFERGLAGARAIHNRYLELNVLAFGIPALVTLGRYDEAGDALALARQIARETQNVEFDPRFDRYDTMIAVLLAFATPGELERPRQAEITDRIARLVRRASTNDDDVGLAHALRWEAAWQLHRDLPKVAEETAARALSLATEHGLRGLVAELRRLQAKICLALGQGKEALTALEDSLAAALATGNRLLAVLNDHAVAVHVHDLARQRAAAQALRDLVADLPEGAREVFERVPERAAVLHGDVAEGQAVEERVGAVLDLMGAITEPDVSLEGVLELAVRALVKIADADRGFLLLYDGVTVSREVFYGMGASDSDVYSRNFADQVFYSQEAVVMEDVSRDFHLGHQLSVQALGLRGVVGVPLIAGSGAIGVIIADCRRVNSRFGPDQRDLVLALARQVAHAIVLAQRQVEQRKEISTTQWVLSVAFETAGKQSFEDFIGPVARASLALTGARRAFLLVGSTLSCRGAYGTDGFSLPGSVEIPRISNCRAVLDGGDSIADLTNGVFYVVPVSHGGKRVGVLCLEGQRTSKQAAHTLATLERVGALVGAFLTNREAATDPAG